MVAFEYDAYVSAVSEEEDLRRKICARLRDAGLRPFRAAGIRYGTAWIPDATRGLQTSQQFVFIVGPGAPPGWMDAEVKVALRCRQADAAGPRQVVPVLAHGATVEHLPADLRSFPSLSAASDMELVDRVVTRIAENVQARR